MEWVARGVLTRAEGWRTSWRLGGSLGGDPLARRDEVWNLIEIVVLRRAQRDIGGFGVVRERKERRELGDNVFLWDSRDLVH